MAKAGTIRGLQMFISDIRACSNREAESKRVDKELAKIRAKFGDEKKALTAYDRKKYVWKLLYIYMLGYDVEFGHKQACDLIPAAKYSEKQVGYMACSILMNERDEFLRLSINAIHSDLTSRNEAFQCLALTFVANIAGPEMAEALTPDVVKLVQAGSARPIVRKKAALCLLRLLRKTAPDAALVPAEAYAPVACALLEERDIGVLLAGATLLLGIMARFGPAGYEAAGPRALRVLERLVALRDVTPDYTYYGIASPWLQVKCLRVLQVLPPPDSPAQQRALREVLQAIFATCGEQARSPTANKANAQHAILFEAIALALALDAGRELLTGAVAALARFLAARVRAAGARPRRFASLHY
ncbi:AP-2 complex subunit alpha-like [Raphidocelis subcapitata]|uniref:AP-2 complex subunit alpha-like n=1 Tax=Raphidocelis subcapitata TaxID=307507 RepID=A0A2V0PGL3_9CHLO|nr:AP-2 complex subunit alpha-like [Raphidocelis subcapitata]|eukprot:GBF98152.1 AP-2 complex subunit alpha-like [Raphidocelis subcapitata]